MTIDNNPLSFNITAKDTSGSLARCGVVSTPHGKFDTPAFMPVGTRATVKTLTPENITQTGAQIILGNTYHLALKPGDEIIAEMGGLHKFMGWNKPILTDSGGFQVFSLSGLRKMERDKVTFKSHIDGSLWEFTPKRVVQIQENLGSDIMMPLDHCCPWPVSKKEAKEAVSTSIRWLEQSIAAKTSTNQALFGIVQGGEFRDLREECAKEMIAMDCPGYSIGGLSVGEPKDIMKDIVHFITPILPEEKPRYLMGVGTPEDFLMAVDAGVDMFDCVLPTRNARNGGILTRNGKLQIRNARHRRDPNPIDEKCRCYCCQNFSRSYVHHLFSKKVEEILGLVLLTIHNLTFFQDLMQDIRQAIQAGNYREFSQSFLASYQS